MGRVLLVARLAARDLRRRPVEAALLVLAITAATATLTLGLVLRDVAGDPYRRTRAATAGPDVVAIAPPDDVTGRPADRDGLAALARAPGVAAHGGPYPVTGAVGEAGGRRATAQVEGRGPASTSAPIDRPQLTGGRWPAGGDAVVEAAFADALGVRAGDRITLNGRPFRVAGVAVTAAAAPYPFLGSPGTLENPLSYCPLPSPSPCDEPPRSGGPSARLDAALRRVDAEHPGLVWLAPADARALAARAAGGPGYVLHLRLDDPAAAPGFVVAHTGPDPDAPVLRSWTQIRDQVASDLTRNRRKVLLFGSRLLGLLAVASAAVLVGGRLADQTRRVGLLKAVGGTPGLVAAVLLAEHAAVALVAAAAGLAAGSLAAPLVAEPGAGLLGSAGTPAVTPTTVGAVAAVALAVVAAATLVPAVRAARTSTVRALADAARAPRRAAWLIALSARLPVALLLGLRVAARRPRRVVLGIASAAVTVSGIVAALAVAGQANEDRGSAVADEQLHRVLVVVAVTLAVLAAVNAVVSTWATAVDARHSSALARALGATPRQVAAGLAVAQVIPALAGAALGVAGGLALLAAVGADDVPGPRAAVLLAVALATVAAVALLAAIPARLGARRAAAPVLSAELA